MSDEKVVGLRGAALPNEPVAVVVEELQGLLARAERGEIRAIAYVVANADGTAGTSWVKPDTPGRVAITYENHALGSGILTLAYRYGAAGDA